MKLTKTVKYHYQITEKTLEKDIGKFIDEARKGRHSWDYKYGSEGLKIIKQYFRILQEKFINGEFGECKLCYEKLILFCIDASCGKDEADFGYEDLLAKISRDFDNFIKNYFICLVKTCSIDELAERMSTYIPHLDIYGFDSDKKILLDSLGEAQLVQLEEKVLKRASEMTKKDQDKQDLIYFFMELWRTRQDKEKYLKLCERFKGILSNREYEELKEEYGDI